MLVEELCNSRISLWFVCASRLCHRSAANSSILINTLWASSTIYTSLISGALKYNWLFRVQEALSFENTILYLFCANAFTNKSLVVLKSGTSYTLLNLSSLTEALPHLVHLTKEPFAIRTVLGTFHLLKLVRLDWMPIKCFVAPKLRIQLTRLGIDAMAVSVGIAMLHFAWYRAV
jgi:hypothetical protein